MERKFDLLLNVNDTDCVNNEQFVDSINMRHTSKQAIWVTSLNSSVWKW